MDSSRSDLRTALQHGLANRQFSVAFQPEYDLTTSTIVAAEALARWTHPVWGEVDPEHFIAAAIEHDVIDELSSWIVDSALHQLSGWTAELDSLEITLRLNITLAQLTRPDFVEEFAGALHKHGVPPGRVCIEITETAPLTDAAATATVVRQLRSLGASVAIDDLANGYSTLGSLRWLPVDVVKVDRSMIAGIDTDVRAVIILSAIMTAARELDAVVVAEGVENEREAAVLRSLGCTHAQGHYLGRPMPGSDFLELLRGESGSRRRPAPSPSAPSPSTSPPAPSPTPEAAIRRRPRPRPR